MQPGTTNSSYPYYSNSNQNANYSKQPDYSQINYPPTNYGYSNSQYDVSATSATSQQASKDSTQGNYGYSSENYNDSSMGYQRNYNASGYYPPQNSVNPVNSSYNTDNTSGDYSTYATSYASQSNYPPQTDYRYENSNSNYISQTYNSPYNTNNYNYDYSQPYHQDSFTPAKNAPTPKPSSLNDKREPQDSRDSHDTRKPRYSEKKSSFSDVRKDLNKKPVRERRSRPIKEEPPKKARTRSPPRKRSHSRHRSPSPKHHSPPRQESKPEVVVTPMQIPNRSFFQQVRGVSDIQRDFPNMYICKDFMHAVSCWQDSESGDLPLFGTAQITTQHLAAERVVPSDVCKTLAPIPYKKEIQAIIANNNQQNIKYSVNVRFALFSGMDLNELAKVKNKEDVFSHLIRFVVCKSTAKDHIFLPGGSFGKFESMDSVTDELLIARAIDYARTQLGIDLAPCKHWIRMMEVWYKRNETSRGEKCDYQEVTVIFIPDIWKNAPVIPSLRRALKEGEERPVEEEKIDEEEDDDEGYTEESLMILRIADLRAMLKQRGKPTTGSKNELVSRLLEDTQNHTEAPENETPTDPLGVVSFEEMDEYGRVTQSYRSQQTDISIITMEDKQVSFKSKILTLNGLLEYTMEDTKEKVFEISLLAEVFRDMLLTRFSHHIFNSMVDAIEAREGDEEKKPVVLQLDILAFIACSTFDKKRKGYLTYDELMDAFVHGNHVSCKSEAERILDAALDNKKLNYTKLFTEKQ